LEGEVKKQGTKKRRNKKAGFILTIVLVVAVILLVVITAAQKLGNMTITTMTSDVRAYFMSIGSGGGFPYSIKSDTVKDIKINKSNLVFLLNDKTVTLTSSAKEIMPQAHSYANPVMKTCGSKMIVYDLDSGKFRVQNGTEIVKEYELDNKIMAADIGKSGNYAVGTYDSSVQSVLTVYGKTHKEDFIWNFKTERIMDISLSDNGKYAAVATVQSNNGTINSKLYVFDFKSEQYVSCFEYNGTTLVRVNYIRSNNIVALGDNLRSYIENNTNRHDDESFNSDILHNYCVNDDGTSAIVLSKYGSTSLSSLTVYSNKNVVKFTVSFDKEMKWVDCDGKYTAVLFDNEVRTYDKSGKQIGSIMFSGEPVRVAVNGNKTYVLTSVSVKCYNTKGTTDDR
jgi:hypothetical protein